MLNGTPIIQASTPWKYLTWKMEYDGERASSDLNLDDLHIVKSLQSIASDKMQWLGNIPPDILINIRKQGATDEIREIISKGINDLSSLAPEELANSKDKVLNNIDNAFSQYKENVKNLKNKKWKFLGKDIGSWMVTGGLGIAAAVTGETFYGVSAFAANQLLDAPKLKDIPNSIKKLIDEDKKIKKSPIGLFFSCKK